jgi:hypothetical protein
VLSFVKGEVNKNVLIPNLIVSGDVMTTLRRCEAETPSRAVLLVLPASVPRDPNKIGFVKHHLLILAVFMLTLVGCADDPKPQPTIIKMQTTKAVTLTIGMKATEAIRQVGIPCDAATLNAINQGANYTLQYQGRSYVFSKGVLQAIR